MHHSYWESTYIKLYFFLWEKTPYFIYCIMSVSHLENPAIPPSVGICAVFFTAVGDAGERHCLPTHMRNRGKENVKHGSTC